MFLKDNLYLSSITIIQFIFTDGRWNSSKYKITFQLEKKISDFLSAL